MDRCRDTPDCWMCTRSTSSFTGNSPSRRVSSSCRRIGSASAAKVDIFMNVYIHIQRFSRQARGAGIIVGMSAGARRAPELGGQCLDRGPDAGQRGLAHRSRRLRLAEFLELLGAVAERVETQRRTGTRHAMREMHDDAERVGFATLQRFEPGAQRRDFALRALDELFLELGHARACRGDAFFGSLVHLASHSALTWAPSAMGSKGLAITPMAESSRNRSASSELALAVMKITGICARPGSWRMRFNSVGPSMPGIITSSTTRSGCSTRILSSARSPPSLVSTLSWPSRLSDICTISRISGSSSTYRRVLSGLS